VRQTEFDAMGGKTSYLPANIVPRIKLHKKMFHGCSETTSEMSIYQTPQFDVSSPLLDSVNNV